MITQERLKQLLVYDADSGGFTWKPRPLGCVSGDAGSLSNGYIRICIDRERYRAHQLAWLYVHGEWPNSIIDHIDGNKSNNKITNLRLVDASKNKQNQPPRKDSKTGVTGVVWDKFYQRWKASIKVQGKTIRLGAHKDFFEAVCRRKSAEQLYFKEYSYGAML